MSFNIFKSWLSIQLAIYQCNVVHIAFDFNILGFRGTCTTGIQYDNDTVSNLKSAGMYLHCNLKSF